MGLGPPSVDIATVTAVDEWRRKATDTLLLVSALVYLPGLVLWLAGQGPTISWPVEALVVATYLVAVAGALLRRIDYRVRARAMMIGGYLFSVVAGIAVPNGPFVRSFPICISIAALVLLGARTGRIGTVVSAVILLFGPFLAFIPGLEEAMASGPVQPHLPMGLMLTQGFALTAALVGLMVLVEQFHAFLFEALDAEHRTATGLEREMRERQRLEHEIARIGDEERRRLGQDVHDGVCQQLTGALLRCQALERGLARNDTLSPADVNALSGLIEEAIDEAHSVAQGLQPLGKDPGALASALRTLANRIRKVAEVRCEFAVSGEVRVDNPASAHHLYRIAQEAASNAVRHARAGRIAMELRGGEDEFMLKVEDDGAGLPAGAASGGMGLSTMAYRAQAMGGTLVVDGAPGGGTRVICRVPRAAIARPGDRALPARKECTDVS